MDRLTRKQRHKCMSAVRNKGTKPELVVRHFLWHHDFRYRINVASLPGHPDIVLRKYHTCIFVNGCFWHGHKQCKYATLPKTNTDFWKNKILANCKRDAEVQQLLEADGWKVIVIWGCLLKPQKRNETLDLLLQDLRAINVDCR